MLSLQGMSSLLFIGIGLTDPIRGNAFRWCLLCFI